MMKTVMKIVKTMNWEWTLQIARCWEATVRWRNLTVTAVFLYAQEEGVGVGAGLGMDVEEWASEVVLRCWKKI